MNVKFCQSLAGFSHEVPPITKNTQGYGYTYTNLTEILRVINPLLKKHGLGITQMVEGSQLITTLFHVETGETLESKMDIPQEVKLKGMNDYQVMGASISYMRRYSISTILCLVTDSDVDAAGDQTKSSKPVITEVRFVKALKAIEEDEYTKKELEDKYALNNEQKKALKNVK